MLFPIPGFSLPRFLFFLCAAAVLTVAAAAQDFSFTPANLRQGEVLKLHARKDATKARMAGVTIPLFEEPDGSAFGLMPVDVEKEPGDYKLEFIDKSAAVIHEAMVTVHDAHYQKQNIVIAQSLSELRSSPEEANLVHAFLSTASPIRYWEEPFQLPVTACMNSPFGVSRLHNGKPTGDYHAGVDQLAEKGVPIHAVAGGIVRIVRLFPLRGGTVAIDHGQGLETISMHMSRFAAKEGQQVKAGDVIGYVGSTGRATGPHLHWSLYANGVPVSPNQWVKLTPCGAPVPRPKAASPKAAPTKK